MKIREATKEDVHDIQYLSKQLGYEYPVEKMSIKLNIILNNPEHMIYVAVDNDRVIGYIHIEIYRILYADDLLNILGIVVDSSYRQKGVGTSLLESTEEYAKKVYCSGIRANSGASRYNAHSFYKRNGFISEKDQKRFVKSVET